MDLKDVSLALRRHWMVALLLFSVVFACGVAAAYLPKQTYRSAAVVAVRPGPVVASGQNPIQIANYEMPIYVERLNSRTFREAVAAQLSPDVAGGSVNIDAGSDIGTGLLRITATSPQASAAASWANALADRIVADANATQGGVLSLEVLDRARVPTSPQSEANALVIGSVVLGCIAAVFAALVANRMVRFLDLGEEVRVRLGAPVLGEIPKARAIRSSSRSLEVVLQDGPRDLIEAFQILRTNVEIELVRSRATSVALTSFRSGEGKSTIAASIGLSMASVGHDITLIDGDLRQPSLHHRLGEPFGEGLADHTVDPSHLVRTLTSGMRFLAAGVPGRHPADVIAHALEPAVEGLQREGALLIIDSPPISGVAETPFIASTAHNVIIVVDASTHDLPELERAVARLRDTGVNIFGVVLNRTRRRRNGRSQPYYSYTLADRPAAAVRRPLRVSVPESAALQEERDKRVQR